MDLEVLLIDLLNGVSRSMVYFLMASGLTVAFSVMGIINFAHGSFVMLGAYIMWSLLHYTGVTWPFLAFLVVTGITVGIVGGMIEKFILRKIYGADQLYQLLLTFILILIIDGLVLEIWGGSPLSMKLPTYLTGGVTIVSRPFPKYFLFAPLCSACIAILFWLFLYKTNSGKVSRATAMDKEITSTFGINVTYVYFVMFAIGGALAGFSGGLGLAMSCLSPGIGANIVVICFAIIVIGGMGSLGGTFIASLILGVFEAFGDHYFPKLAMALPYILMSLILIIRPQGLFGAKQ